MREDVDDRVHDVIALDEIDLVADVLSAVAAADRPLTEDEIDAVLGLPQARDAAPSRSGQDRLSLLVVHDIGRIVSRRSGSGPG